MGKLNDLYQLAENDAILEEKLKQANKAVQELPEEEQEAAAKEAIIKLAGEAGITLGAEDFFEEAGMVSDDALTDVAGGFSQMGLTQIGRVVGGLDPADFERIGSTQIGIAQAVTSGSGGLGSIFGGIGRMILGRYR